jgi:ribonuclease P protein component
MEEKFLQEEEAEAERNSQFLTRRSLNSSSGALSFDQFDLSILDGRKTFGKEEKLKSKKIIDQLFKEGKSVSVNGFTLVYLMTPLSVFYPAQAGFSVPKRHFKSATDRNRIKRLMREVYRNNKHSFYKKLAESKQQMACMFVYKGKDIPDFEVVSKAVISCLNRVTLS